MNIEKANLFLEKLIQTTNDGKITWQRSGSEGAFRMLLDHSFTCRTERFKLTIEPSLRINGIVSVLQLTILFDSDRAYSTLEYDDEKFTDLLNKLFEVVKTSVLSVEDVIDEFIKNY